MLQQYLWVLSLSIKVNEINSHWLKFCVFFPEACSNCSTPVVCGGFSQICYYVGLFVVIGITWTLLHEMDYQKYISVRHDYILLPEDALTNTTRLRWWQPFVISNRLVVSGVERAQWALDNILIGGAEINPSQLVDTFDDGKKQDIERSFLWAVCLFVFLDELLQENLEWCLAYIWCSTNVAYCFAP